MPVNPPECPGADTPRYTVARLDPPVTHVIDRSDPARVRIDTDRAGAPRVTQTLAHGLVAIDRLTAQDRLTLTLAEDLGPLLPLSPGVQFTSPLTVTTARGEPLPGALTLRVGAAGELSVGPCRYPSLAVETVTSVGPHASTAVLDYVPILGVALTGGHDSIAVTPPPTGVSGLVGP